MREGQFLLIPVALSGGTTEPFDATSAPGQGTATPVPPSAAKPLPPKDAKPIARPSKTAAAPNLSNARTQASIKQSRLAFPVTGDIVQEYKKGKNDGIDIAAAPGAPVKAAADGKVAAITQDTNGVTIIVVRHPEKLMTVYTNIANVSVKDGDQVKRGQKIAEIRRDGATALHFQVREDVGNRKSVDPMQYLN